VRLDRAPRNTDDEARIALGLPGTKLAALRGEHDCPATDRTGSGRVGLGGGHPSMRRDYCNVHAKTVEVERSPCMRGELETALLTLTRFTGAGGASAVARCVLTCLHA
jgi:hypothetical protein